MRLPSVVFKLNQSGNRTNYGGGVVVFVGICQGVVSPEAVRFTAPGSDPAVIEVLRPGDRCTGPPPAP